jgi:Fe2+ transport system protein FeoA
MTLDQARKGSEVTILTIPNESSRSQLLRLGIMEGTRAYCHEKLPMGPVILRRKRQEIAIGYQLAKGIEVET